MDELIQQEPKQLIELYMMQMQQFEEKMQTGTQEEKDQVA
jgi:hypothetical protein